MAILRRLLLVVLVACGAIYGVQRIRQRPLPRLSESVVPRPAGAFHVHSNVSHDSDVTIERIAAAAGELGLSFVVITDHNNQLAGPVTIDGVTLLSHAELSTPVGHLIQLAGDGVPDPAMRGSMQLPAAIRAGGGIPVVAHPSDRKRPWHGSMEHVGGVEIANLASSARSRAGPMFVGLLPALLAWRLNPPLALTQVYDQDRGALARWDDESDPGVIGLCGTDAHGRIDLVLNLRAWRVVLHHPLPEVESERQMAILDQLEKGRFHCTAGLYGQNPELRFAGQHAGRSRVTPGDSAPTTAVDSLIVRAPALLQGEGEVHTVLLRNGEQVARTVDRDLVYSEPDAGTYRVEVRIALPEVLWGHRILPVMYSNRIRITAPSQAPALDSTVEPDMSAPPRP